MIIIKDGVPVSTYEAVNVRRGTLYSIPGRAPNQPGRAIFREECCLDTVARNTGTITIAAIVAAAAFTVANKMLN